MRGHRGAIPRRGSIAHPLNRHPTQVRATICIPRLDVLHRVVVLGAIDHREMQRPFVVAIGRAVYFEPTPKQFSSEQC